MIILIVKTVEMAYKGIKSGTLGQRPENQT